MFTGHQFLHNQGILHRDISAGNVLLGTGNRYGFVMDLEFAHHACSSLDTKTVIEPMRRPGGGITEQTTRTHTKFDNVSVKRGAVMTVSVASTNVSTHLTQHYSRERCNSWRYKSWRPWRVENRLSMNYVTILSRS